MRPAELVAALRELLVRVLQLPDCDGWTAAVLETFLRGEVSHDGFTLLVQARADELALAILRGGGIRGASPGLLGLTCAVDALHGVLTIDIVRAIRSLELAQGHMASVGASKTA